MWVRRRGASSLLTRHTGSTKRTAKVRGAVRLKTTKIHFFQDFFFNSLFMINGLVRFLKFVTFRWEKILLDLKTYFLILSE